MKTSRPTVHLVLDKTKKNRQNKCPIVLRIQFKGRRNCSTGCSTRVCDWDSRTESVKSSDADYQAINTKIQRLKSDVLGRINHFETLGQDYTVQMLLDERMTVSRVFADVLSSMVAMKGLSHNSEMAYTASLHRLERFFGEGFLLSAITSDSLKGFASFMKKSSMSDSTINVTLACVKSVLGFAKGQGLYDGSVSWKYWKTYRIQDKHRALTSGQIRYQVSKYVQSVTEVHLGDSSWCYTDSAERDLMNRNSAAFAMAVGLMCYYLQGLAFCDMVRIKSENVSSVVVDGKEYYCFSGLKRKKTNREIKPIVVERSDEVEVLFNIFIRTMDLRSGYLLPVLQNNSLDYHYDTDKKVSECTASCSTVINKNLQKHWSSDLGIDFDLSIYVYRHSFATEFIMSGGNPVELAYLMGRSPSGIFRYVNELNSIEGVIKAKYK